MIDTNTKNLSREYFTLKNIVFLTLLLNFSVIGVASAESKKVSEAVEQALLLKPDIERGKNLYFTCAVCHTPEGWGNPSGVFPQISGQHQSVILKQLADIHDGNRDNPTMIPFSTTIFQKGPQSLADLSAYIQQLPMVPNNSVGSGLNLESAEKKYKENCTKCHGENGEGDAKEFYPRIQGQHYQYLLRQMEWIKSGKRRNADSKMVKQIEGFSHRDLSLIADYVSRLKPDEKLVADKLDWRNPDFRAGFMTAPKVQDKQATEQ